MKNSTLLTDNQISKRLKKSLYWVRKVTGRGRRNKFAARGSRDRKVQFSKINERIAILIAEIVSKCPSPL
jgi:hypothetical protein